MKISRRSYLKTLTAETVVLNTVSDESFRGVLIAVHSDVYVLRHAAYLNPDGSKVAIDGEVLVPVTRVSFLQRILTDGGQ